MILEKGGEMEEILEIEEERSKGGKEAIGVFSGTKK